MTAVIIGLLIIQALLALAGIGLMLWLIFLILPAFFGGPPFVGTSPERVQQMMALAQLAPGERVIDLGSGDGRLLLAAAKAGAEAVGYELNPFLVWWSRRQARQAGVAPQVRVHWGNFWSANLNSAEVIMIFGFSTIMAKLSQKLASELKPGSRVISYRYELPGWKLEGQVGHVYQYRKV